ncbi:MAG: polysaccharide pyruvyl transferase family protein [Bacteroidia bacterium]
MKYYYQIEGLKRNNLGDVIQGLAAKQFLPNDATPVNREKLSSLTNEPSLLIANGWYQHEFDKFPPPTEVIPFYISVHIAKSDFIKIKSIREHFIKNAPIGCRDLKTLWLMRGFGIPAYYSSCLTLTFNNSFSFQGNKSEVIWVDNIDHPIPLKIEQKLNDLIPEGFTKISHDPLSRFMKFENYVEDNTELTFSLFKRYEQAKLVLTTKIHCALPCIGMAIPVILIHPNPKDPRLSVLSKLITIISYDDLMEYDSLPEAAIKKDKADKIKKNLTYLLNLAVKNNKNPFTDKANTKLYLQYQKYKFISSITSFGLKAIYKLGFFKKSFERVFGKEYLID